MSEIHIIWYHVIVIIYIKFSEETVTNMNKGMTAYDRGDCGGSTTGPGTAETAAAFLGSGVSEWHGR